MSLDIGTSVAYHDGIGTFGTVRRKSLALTRVGDAVEGYHVYHHLPSLHCASRKEYDEWAETLKRGGWIER